MAKIIPSNLMRMWFPFALVAILLLAIPGFILFVLNLIGLETDVSVWLEKTFRLSYHIPIPWWGALLLFLVPPLLILLYFLKLKRKPVQVPSTFLWKKSIEDLHVNSLFQWLRNNILLILQLLVLLSLIYGILAPRLHGAGGRGKHYILMIDNSASMSATDVAPNRLEWAKAEAVKEIDAATDADFGMLIVFNSRAEIRQSYTSDRSILRNRVREIEATERTTNIEEALNLADSLANPKTSAENEAVKPDNAEPGKERTYAAPEGVKAEVHLYSDGRFADVQNFTLGNLDLRYHAAGVGSNNVALVDLNAVRDENDKSQIQVFARILNFSDQEVSLKVKLEAHVAGGKQWLPPDKPIRIAPFGKRQGEGNDTTALERPGERTVTFDVPDADDQTEVVIHVQLTDFKDDFVLDNEGWLVVGVVRKARVLIVGPPNQFLKAVFNEESTDIAEVTWLSLDDFKKDKQTKYLEPARSGAYDLVIFDRCAPDKRDGDPNYEMPRGNTFFIGAFPPEFAFDPAKKVEKVFVKDSLKNNSLMRYLTGMHEVGATVVYKIDNLPPKTPLLLEGEDNLAMMLSLTRNAHTDIVQLFPLVTESGEWNTNWPLQPSFPIFWRNVLYALGNVSDAASEEPVQPGNPKRLRPSGITKIVTVKNPAGDSVDLERTGNRSDFDFQGTDRVGVYVAKWPGGSRGFAVNLLDSDESNIRPRESIKIGDDTVVAADTRSQSRELWKWAVAAAFLFLLLEWYVYNKRVYV
jgi:hypothetical protein